MMEQFSVIRKHLKKKLDPRRFEHTLGVEFTCAALAMRYGYDIKKAQLAGLLHDCAKWRRSSGKSFCGAWSGRFP